MTSFKRIQVMFDRYSDCFTQIKALLDLPNENHDPVIKFVLNKTLNDVSSYLHRQLNDIPLELDSTIISMVVTYVDTHNLLNRNNNDNISSLTEGNVQVQYKSTAEVYSKVQAANLITDDYANQLKQYRKLAR